MGDKKSKSDIDMLSELSCMPSITSRERKSTLNDSGSGGNGGFTSKFKSEKEMNDYIQKCINDALNQKPKPNGAVKTTSTVKEEYSNPRKESATGKHAGVNSFIRNLGTIGYGEERKDMVNNKSFANGGGHAKGKSEEKIADNILQKLKEREEKDKKAKERGEPVEKKKPKYKSTKKKEKEAEEPVEIAPEDKKIYSFTKVHSVFNSEMPMSQQIMNQQQQMRGQMLQQQQMRGQMRGQMPGQMRNQMHGQMRSQMPGQMNNQMHGQMRNQMPGQMNNQMHGQMRNQVPVQMNNQTQGNTQQRPFMGMTGNSPSARGNQIQHPIRNQAPNQIVGNQIQNSFVFIMPSYNGVKWIKRIFDSIRSQTYTNYRIIYVDDCSTDNTVKEINSYKRANPQMNIEVITNQTRQWPAYSRFVACRQVYDHEVCVFLDGDDWLVDNDCLSTLNTVFQNPNIYATFGSMSNAPWQYKKWKKYNRANINDGEGAYFPHLRTTRAAIVKAIPPYYMQTDNHEWLHVCTDVALFMAVIEAVGQDGYVFLKNEFVHYNTANHSKNTKEGYNNSKGSDMRLYYRSTIRDKIPMKKIVRSGVAGTPQQNMLNYAHNQQQRTVSQSRRYR